MCHRRQHWILKRGTGWGWLCGGRPGIPGTNVGGAHRWPQESPRNCHLSLRTRSHQEVVGGFLFPGWDSSGFSIVPRSRVPPCGACAGHPEGGQVGRCE